MNVEQLQGGELVRLLLHSEKAEHDIVTRFVGYAIEGEYRRARFQEEGSTFVWNARQVGDKWLYGVNEHEHLEVGEVLEKGNGAYIFDKHLVKLAARKRPEPGSPDYQGENRQYRKPKRGTGRYRYAE